MSVSSSPLLEITQLTKRFGGRHALQDVSFALAPGEILGVVGRRGAGKSILLQILAGLQTPTNGTLRFKGRPLRFASPAQAHRQGIELVPQIPLFSEQLNVLTNIFLGRELGGLFPDWKRMASRASEVLAALDLSPDLLQRLPQELSDEQRQGIAITRALCFSPAHPAALILLDDVLAALTYQRQEKLLTLIQAAAAQGISFLVASDNLKHLFAITQRILVFYEGRLVSDQRTAETTPREVVELIVGSTRQEQVTPMIWALENYHKAQQQAEELNRMQTSLRESLEAQGSLNQELLERLRAQVGALNQLNVALQATQRRLMTEREAERKALARELHDQVIQDLLSFNYRLEDLQEEAVLAAPQAAELAALRVSVRQIVGDLRQLCSDLRPPTIDAHGVSAAIRSHAQEWAEQNNIALQLDLEPDLGRLPEAVELSIFRIVQEALHNIRRHAEAQHVTIALKRTSNANIMVRFTDDGQGLAEPVDLAALSAQKHFGLVGISERVALLSGKMQIASKAGEGLTLVIEVPSPSPAV